MPSERPVGGTAGVVTIDTFLVCFGVISVFTPPVMFDE